MGLRLITFCKSALAVAAGVLAFAVPANAQDDRESLKFLSGAGYEAVEDWAAGKKRFVLFEKTRGDSAMHPYFVCLFEQPAFSNEIADRATCKRLRLHEDVVRGFKSGTTWDGYNGTYIMTRSSRAFAVPFTYVCLVSVVGSDKDFTPNTLCKAQ
jgi:hypothetical protein